MTRNTPNAPPAERYRFDSDVLLGDRILGSEVADFARGRDGECVVVVGAGHVDTYLEHVESHVAKLQVTLLELPRIAEYAALAEWSLQVGSPKCLVAIGGGAVLDLAKLLTIQTPNGDPLLTVAESREDFQSALGPNAIRIPSLAAPTVVGSGAEVSHLADVLLDDHGCRNPVIDLALIPDRAVVDAAVLASVPADRRKPAMFDCIMHILDPWVNSVGAPPINQSRSSISALKEILAYTQVCATQELSASQMLDFARLSHLAIRPGLVRPASHASTIHRIEHALPAGFADSHGEGLAWVAVRFFAWLQSQRRPMAQEISPMMAEAWGVRVLPAELIRGTAELLSLPVTRVMPSEDALAVASRCVESFASDGQLPGTLKISASDVHDILCMALDDIADASPFVSSYPADPVRVLGDRSDANLPLVITPVRAVFTELTGAEVDGAGGAWFPTKLASWGAGSARCVLIPVGASATVDALDLLRSIFPDPPMIIFAGLAARLDESLDLAAAYVSVSGTPTASVRANVDETARPQIARVASATSIAEEGAPLIAYLQFHQVNALDLETAAFYEWCARNKQRGSVVLGISDDLSSMDVRPIWHQTAEDGVQVVKSCAREIAGCVENLLRAEGGSL